MVYSEHTENRIRNIATGVADDALCGDILGHHAWSVDSCHDTVFHITLGVCDDEPELSHVEAGRVSVLVDEAIAEFIRENHPLAGEPTEQNSPAGW